MTESSRISDADYASAAPSTLDRWRYWVRETRLVRGRLGRAENSPQTAYHPLRRIDESKSNEYTSGYRSLCGKPNRWGIRVYDATRVGLSDGKLCEECQLKKRKMLAVVKEEFRKPQMEGVEA